MKTREELSKRFSGQLASDLINGSNPTSNRTTWLILAMLAFVGEEAIQVLFRRNFGKGGLNLLRIIMCFLLFEIIAVIFFLWGAQISESMAIIGTRSSFTWAALFYMVLGFIILLKGLTAMKKATNSSSPYKFTGESAVLSFLEKDGWSQSSIQNIAEPVVVLGLGIALSFVNILWGVVLIYCALSVWGCKIMDTVFLEPADPQPTSHQQQGRNFHDIK